MTAGDYAAAGRPDGVMINLGTNDWGHVVGKTSNNTAAFVKVRAFSSQPSIQPFVHSFICAIATAVAFPTIHLSLLMRTAL
jgi:hypothetical protein